MSRGGIGERTALPIRFRRARPGGAHKWWLHRAVHHNLIFRESPEAIPGK